MSTVTVVAVGQLVVGQPRPALPKSATPEEREAAAKAPPPVRTVQPGETVELEADLARDMLARGMVRRPGEGPASGSFTRPAAPTDPTARLAAIAAAIPALDPEEDFTAKGLPSVPALERRLGWDITPAERDTAWRQVAAA